MRDMRGVEQKYSWMYKNGVRLPKKPPKFFKNLGGVAPLERKLQYTS